MLQAGTMRVTFLEQPVYNPINHKKQKAHPQGGFFAFWGGKFI
jgi:hypothetical protein